MAQLKRNKERERLLKVYGHLYEMDVMVDRMSCVYCNDTRETVDHIPPVSLAEYYAKDIPVEERKVRFICVPCCSACNAKLGAKNLPTYEDRLIYLYNSLVEQSSGVTIWTPDEIEELSGDLKRKIVAKQLQVRREILLRLRGMESRISTLSSTED